MILGKPLGIGILAQAMKKDLLDQTGYQALLDVTTQLNRVGSTLALLDGVHALTDVTGFGLLGHLLELCRGANLSSQLDLSALPVISAAWPFVKQNIGPGAIERNLHSFASELDLTADQPTWWRQLLADPQTSGGLLVSVQPSVADEVLQCFHQAGFSAAAQIGRLQPGPVRVRAY